MDKELVVRYHTSIEDMVRKLTDTGIEYPLFAENKWELAEETF